MDNSNPWLIFLGALLTFLATGLIEYLKGWLGKRQYKMNLVTFLKLEFITIAENLIKIKGILELNNYFDYALTSLINDQVKYLLDSRSSLINIDNSEIQTKIIKYIFDLRNFSTGISGFDQFYNDSIRKLNDTNVDTPLFKSKEDLENYFNKKRIEKLVDLMDLQRRAEELTKLL